jgi:hypothetical protein
VGKYWLFLSPSRSFGYGFEAVRIRVKPTSIYSDKKRKKIWSFFTFSMFSSLTKPVGMGS